LTQKKYFKELNKIKITNEGFGEPAVTIDFISGYMELKKRLLK